MYIIFKNDGEIDERVISLMGVSAKMSDDSIGYFGTGLKYAISTILRGGGNVTIYSGAKRLLFYSKREVIRGQEFDVVYMNDERLPFTLKLGRDWEMWQAYREIYSNCIDESGSKIYASRRLPDPVVGKTIIAVHCADFFRQHEKRGEIFICDSDNPISSSAQAEIYQGSGIYFRGVRVKDRVACKYKHNITKKISLTEDRTAKYDFQVLDAIGHAVATSHNKKLIEDLVTTKQSDFFEGGIDYSSIPATPSHQFIDTVLSLRRERPTDLKEGAWELCSKYTSEGGRPEPVDLTDHEASQLSRACGIAERLGFLVNSYPINTYESLGTGVLALAHRGEDGKEIMLTRELFTKGVLTLARGIIEEYIHLRHGFEDESRPMQNYLFDKMMHFGMASIGEVA